DNVGNVGSSAASGAAKVDTDGPTSSLTLLSDTGNAYKVGNTVFYRGSAGGSFKLTNAVTDAESGPASSATAALGGTTNGWSHTPSTVSTPAGGPYDSNTFSWGARASSSPTETRTAADTAGNSAAAPTLTFTNDTNAPATTIQCNGAACLNGTYYTSSPVVVTLSADDGTGSGVQTIRYTTDGSDPTPVNGSDYLGAINVNATTTVKFRSYDNLGNEEAVGSQQILLDGTPPIGPTLTLTQNPTSAGQDGSGPTLFYKPGGSGTFRVTAATNDPQTGVTGVSFPAIANVTGGGSVASAPYRMDYTWGASTSDSGSHDVDATNGAGATSSAPFTLTPDSS